MKQSLYKADIMARIKTTKRPPIQTIETPRNIRKLSSSSSSSEDDLTTLESYMSLSLHLMYQKRQPRMIYLFQNIPNNIQNTTQ